MVLVCIMCMHGCVCGHPVPMAVHHSPMLGHRGGEGVAGGTSYTSYIVATTRGPGCRRRSGRLMQCSSIEREDSQDTAHMASQLRSLTHTEWPNRPQHHKLFNGANGLAHCMQLHVNPLLADTLCDPGYASRRWMGRGWVGWEGGRRVLRHWHTPPATGLVGVGSGSPGGEREHAGMHHHMSSAVQRCCMPRVVVVGWGGVAARVTAMWWACSCTKGEAWQQVGHMQGPGRLRVHMPPRPRHVCLCWVGASLDPRRRKPTHMRGARLAISHQRVRCRRCVQCNDVPAFLPPPPTTTQA